MTEIIPIFLTSTIIAFLSHLFSSYNEGLQNYVKKDRFFVIINIICLAIFAGMREGYNDTWVYTGTYEVDVMPLSKEMFKSLDWTIGANPAFFLTMSILKSLNFSTHSFLLFFALISISICFWFIYKYTSDIFLSTFLFLTFGGLDFALTAVKQFFAIAICLIAIDRLIEGHKIQFFLIVLIAVFFHPYAIMFLLCPLLFFKPWTKNTYYMLVLFMLAGLSLNFMLDRILALTALIGEEYTTDTFSDHGVNPLRFLVCTVPIVLSFVFRRQINDHYDPINNLLVNLTMLNGALMFVALFADPVYFGRLANYFLVFQFISIPWLIKFSDKRLRPLLYISAMVFFFAYFTYYNMFAHEGATFDDVFKKISFWEYIDGGVFGYHPASSPIK